MKAKKKQLTIISFNVFGAPFFYINVLKTLFRTHIRRRFAHIVKELNNSDADVLLLQEVHTFGQLTYFKEQLTKFPHVAHTWNIYGPRGGMVIFSKLPLTDITYYNFNKQGVLWNKSIVANLARRGVLAAKLVDYPLYVMNTHLTQNADHDFSPNNRYMPYIRAQLREVAEHIHMIAKKEYNVIIGGDFNMPKTSTLYSEFVKTAKVTDIFAEEDRHTYHDEYALNGPLGRVDFLFLYEQKSSVGIKTTRHIFTEKIPVKKDLHHYPSDHIGLEATLMLQ